jgi:hypothetical protein
MRGFSVSSLYFRSPDERRTIPYPCALKPHHLQLGLDCIVSQWRANLVVDDETPDNGEACERASNLRGRKMCAVIPEYLRYGVRV